MNYLYLSLTIIVSANAYGPPGGTSHIGINPSGGSISSGTSCGSNGCLIGSGTSSVTTHQLSNNKKDKYWWNGSGNPFKDCIPGTPGCRVSKPWSTASGCGSAGSGCKPSVINNSGTFSHSSSSHFNQGSTGCRPGSFGCGSGSSTKPGGCRPGTQGCGSYSNNAVPSQHAINFPTHSGPTSSLTSGTFHSQSGVSSSSNTGSYNEHSSGSILGGTLSSGLETPAHTSTSNSDHFPSSLVDSNIPSKPFTSHNVVSQTSSFSSQPVPSHTGISQSSHFPSSSDSFQSHSTSTGNTGSNYSPVNSQDSFHSQQTGIPDTGISSGTDNFQTHAGSISGNDYSSGASSSYSGTSSLSGGSLHTVDSSKFPSHSGSSFQTQSGSVSGGDYSSGPSSPHGGSSSHLGGSLHTVNSNKFPSHSSSSFQTQSGSVSGSDYSSGPSSSHGGLSSQLGGSLQTVDSNKFPLHSGSSGNINNFQSHSSFGQSGFPSGGHTSGSHNVEGIPFVQGGSDPHSLRPISPATTGSMMMPMGMNLLGGTCSAGTFCVPIETCNPYNGFIIRNSGMIPAALPGQQEVPRLKCFVPAGGISDGVCCQEAHPIIGPNGQAVD